MSISPERLRELLVYDAETGVFTRRVGARSRQAGTIVGTRDSYGYLVTKIQRRMYKLHRLAWLYMTGEWPDQIDHIDGIRDNNRWSNLRNVDGATNQQNQRRAQGDNRSCGLLGVTRLGDRWMARILVAGKRVQIGSFSTPEAAHAAYVAAKRELHAGCTL